MAVFLSPYLSGAPIQRPPDLSTCDPADHPAVVDPRLPLGRSFTGDRAPRVAGTRRMHGNAPQPQGA
ncbi:hypothethical protein [Ralstonia solanacearum PSI07]|nr:hypothethical protein [Ralstonia solanacearum PSI07]